jgi:hypothetical protein
LSARRKQTGGGEAYFLNFEIPPSQKDSCGQEANFSEHRDAKAETNARTTNKTLQIFVFAEQQQKWYPEMGCKTSEK